MFFISDQNNCHSHESFELTQPDEIIANGVIDISNGLVSIDVDVEGGAGTYDFDWSDGSFFEDLENVVFGYYELTITDENNCVETIDFTALDPNLSVDGAVNVYPTITSDEVNVDIRLSREQKVRIQLVDELGRVVQVFDPTRLTNQVITFDLENQSSAVYFLRIEVGKELILRKVVKVLE